MIRRFVDALVQRWPENLEEDINPWAATPLIFGARGPYIYLTSSWRRAEETSAFAADVAAELGLVCFDPQNDQLR